MAVFPHSTQALKSSRAWRTYLSAPSLVAHRKTVRSQHGKREEGGGGQLAGSHGQMSRNQIIIIFSTSVLEFLELAMNFSKS